MTSPLPPKRRDSRDLADLIRQDRTRLGQLDRGLAGGRFPPARPLKPAGLGDGEEDDFDDPSILFANSDHAACSADGATIRIPLTHVPEPGSEQVYYNGTPLKWSDWSRTDTVLTIPGEPWFRAGKVAWVDYAYYDEGQADTEPASFVAATTITGDHTSIDIPGTPTPGDMLVLVLFGRDTVACSDSRFTYKTGGGGYWGVWVGTDDGTTTTVPITLSSPSGAGVDGAGALARITGAPLLPATSEQTSGASGSSTFTPTMPASGSFGVIALISGTGLVSGTLSDDTLGNWTTRAKPTGGGSGFCKVYIGTAAGVPAGQWSNSGSSPGWGAWVGGLQ